MSNLWQAIFKQKTDKYGRGLAIIYNTEGKQTYLQLSQIFNCSLKTIQRNVDKYREGFHYKDPREVVVLMDTTYFGRRFGVMLFKDAYSGENLLKYFVKYETNALYKQGINTLQERGFIIRAIVCDGRRGLFNQS